ncbi:LPS-assembly protein LptD [Caulobacter mirabilis]|uniref:LPS-assembly protein LptD n=1 Tax=Caulobacter mirabilis TaxID=69666 RepID=A0A2D2AZ34_9CAUL|nr:LPS-assembly protein LptD [Caulobacter mirabilis]ATQ43244.1 organic solvent tolerance protein [Caulobacter mirabilis]
MSYASRRFPVGFGRAGLLAGAAVLALAAASPALAQSQPAAPPADANDDGLGEQGFYLEANELIRDDANQVVSAEGDIEVRYRGRTLRANKLVYELKTGVITASENVVIIDPTGAVSFADKMVLDEEMRAGVALGFSTRLEDNTKLAAATAIRRSEAVNELNRAIYTPCEICAENKDKAPTWSIRAEKVVQDRDKRVVYYRNAVIEMFGVPVFYAPAFWHADPSAERASGLLAPKLLYSDRRGISYEQPYAWIISPSQDLVISPQINTKVNPLLNFQWRKRFWSGEINARFGYTYERDIDSNGSRVGKRTSRSYLLGSGDFKIDENWSWGFAAERTSDDLLFDKYDIGDVYQQRGLIPTDDKRLTSQVYAIRQDARSYFSISALSIQGLRPDDDDRTFPLVAPLVEARWEPEGPVFGGRLRLQGSAVALTRDQSQYVASQPGVDSRRVSAQGDWRSTYTFAGGLRLSPFAELRTDVYSLNDLPPPYAPGGDTITRTLGVAGVDVSYPLWRRDGDRTIVLEPLLQVALSPDSDPDSRIPNEDSVVLEFDETNLMRANKFPGFDLYEGGQRINVGGRASVMYDDGRGATLLVGRSFRSKRDLQFPARSGLRSSQSDWIVAAEARPIKGVSFFTRARFDGQDGDVRRIEAGVDVVTNRVDGFIRYLRDNQDITGVQREDLDFAGNVLISGNWGVTFAGVRDVENDVWRRQELGVRYRDDCLDVAVVWVHEETYNRQLGPSDSVILRLKLATLGDKGYSQ